MGPRRETCTDTGSRGSRVQVLRAQPGGGGAPGGHTPWSSLAACTWGGCNHRMTRAGTLNQCFSNCNVSRTHLGSRDSESVGLGYRQDSMFLTAFQTKPVLLVHASIAEP